MSRVIRIAGVIRTSDVRLEGTNPESELTYAEDHISFIVKSGAAPTNWQEITIDDNTERIFAGIIRSVKNEEKAPNIIWYHCTATDYTYQLDAREVNESYGEINLFGTALSQKFNVAWTSGILNGNYSVTVEGGTGSLVLTGGAAGTVGVGGELSFTVSSATVTFTPTGGTPTGCILGQSIRADEIVLDIAGRYCTAFTTVHVSTGAPLVGYIEFIAKRPSECFKALCEYTGWQWYVDYYRDIWFFDPSVLATPAPITVDGSAEVQKLVHELETENLRNRIKVVGSYYLSDPYPFEFTADGTTTLWVLSQVPYDLLMTEGGTIVTVGIEGTDEETGFDYMINMDTPSLRTASGHTTPAVGIKLEGTYKYKMPVVTISNNISSQVAVAAILGGDGIFEHTITDDSITTLDAAEALAASQDAEFANPRVKGSFTTHTTGWVVGQIVPVNRPDRGIVGNYVVQKITRTPVTTELWETKVEYGGRLIGIADYLVAIVSAQQKKITAATAIIKVEYFEETASVTDELITTPRTPPYICGDTDAICGFVMCSS